jgi:hypothetical protein
MYTYLNLNLNKLLIYYHTSFHKFNFLVFVYILLKLTYIVAVECICNGIFVKWNLVLWKPSHFLRIQSRVVEVPQHTIEAQV